MHFASLQGGTIPLPSPFFTCHALPPPLIPRLPQPLFSQSGMGIHSCCPLSHLKTHKEETENDSGSHSRPHKAVSLQRRSVFGSSLLSACSFFKTPRLRWGVEEGQGRAKDERENRNVRKCLCLTRGFNVLFFSEACVSLATLV